DSLVDVIKNARVECEKHSTIDVYAKYLYLTRKFRELGHVNILIAIGILYFQKNEKVDLRYDNFWASLLEDVIPPDNIKIISWNYDTQVEIAFQKFSDRKDIIESQAFLNLFPSNSYSSKDDYRRSTGFAMVKLNGGLVKYDSDRNRFSCIPSGFSGE